MLIPRFLTEVALARFIPRLASRCLFLLALLVSSLGAHEGKASSIPGLPVPGRPWAALLIEDHKGMQEVVWDAAFNDLQAAGPFVKNHSYVISTGSKPRLLDLGCWDASKTRGGECHDMTSPATLTWTADRKGVVLKAGTHATWLPALGGFDGDELPNTFRGAYLNWLLTHRPTTPAIPKETRWQRVQRGATTIATQLFSQGGGKPSVRLVGIGTSGHLLIPPGESLSQLLLAIQRMHPQSHDGEGGHERDDHRDRDGDRDNDCDRDGSMLKALQRAYSAVSFHGSDHDCDHDCDHQDHREHGNEHHDRACDHRDHRDHAKDHPGHDCDHQDHREHGKEHHGNDCDHRDHRDHDCGHPANSCMPNVVFPISDGVAFGTSCGSARPYEALVQYKDMLKVVADIAATGQGVVWPWNVEGPGTWDQDFATKGKGQAFEGDAVAAMGTAFKAWMSASGSAPAVTLKLSTPDLTRVPGTVLTVSLSSPATSATLNGQPLALTGLNTAVPLVLNEGVNNFTVAIQSACGNSQASISVVLDTHAPLITIQSPAEGLRTNAPSVTLTGTVDDPAAAMTINGLSVPQTNGAFTATFTPAEGPFTMTVLARDLAGNTSSVVRTITFDRTGPVITLTKPLPVLISAPFLVIQGKVDDPAASLSLNGQSVTLTPTGGFQVTMPLVEGTNPFHFVAMDTVGNAGTLDATTVRDTQAPVITILSPEDGWRTNAATVTLSGRVDDPTAALTVNGQPLAQASGAFTATFTPAEGPFSMTVVAKDLAGNSSTATRSIVIDRTAPRITLTSSVPTLTSAASLALQGQVDDPSAVLTVNGHAVVLNAQGGFSVTLPLTEGTNPFQFVAMDLAGNAGTLEGSTTRDSIAPVVTISAPTEGWRTNAATVTLTGSVDDPTATLTVNGQPLSQSNGSFSTSLNPAEGSFAMNVVAKDAAGNTGTALRTIIVDRTAPRITLSKPVPALVGAVTLSIQGLVDDPSARLTINGAAAVLDAQGAFLADVPLNEGANTIHLEATDLTGNVGVLDAKTLRDTTPPVVTLDSPLDGLVTNQHSILVKGRVDDPTARLLVAGQSLSPAADGSFEVTLSPSEGSQLIVVLATDPAGNTGHAVRNVTLDWTPPALTWAAPTPVEGAKVTSAPVAVFATVSESATVLLNGQTLTLENGAPYTTKTTLSPGEGPVTLRLEATDRAGNKASIERHFDLGQTAPVVVLESPAEGLQTQDSAAVLAGHVDCGDFLKPLTLTLNGATVSVGADGRFSLPVQLTEGANAFKLVATNAFGLQGQAARTLNRFTTPFGIQLDWPLEGLAIPAASVEVRGRVLRPGTNVAVNGTPGPVDATSLRFAVVVPLQPGLNTLTANATDAAGNQGQALVHVSSAPPVAATYRWDLPANGGASHSRVVHIQGQADIPGITSVRINGQAMSLSGTGRDGQFAGDITLEAKGRNALYLEARTLTGATLNERRDVSFVPDLPRVRLQAPETARPGDIIPIQVSPETGTRLTNADISWNGRFLVRVTDPFAAVTAQVPADAVVGSRIPIEVLATDAEGEQVTARTAVTIYGQGALLVEAYDDVQGLPLKEGQALVEGGEAQTLDATGKAALRTALPQNWIKVSLSGFTPVWRPASLQVGGVQAVVDARLTPLAVNQPITVGAFTGQFGKGALSLAFPAGAFQTEGTLSATPLSTQGLPGLLPSGWSAVSAWWLDTGAVLPASAGTATLTLPAGAPQDNLTWVRWDEGLHAWVTLGTGLHASNLSGLAMASPGGFALVVPDAGLTAPPAAITNAQLPAYEGAAWRDGLVASGSVDPATLATTAAIHGARATAKFALDFNGKDPLPSGSVIQVDVLESYALLDSAVIEPDGFTQDAVLSRWLLGVDSEGAPTLKAARDLGLELPVRMSRTFQENELVDGHIWVGFYHDGIQVAQNGSELLDASGGTVTHDGMQLTIPVQALTGTTLIRLNADQGDPASLWPELAGQGTLAKSFQLDIVGTVQQGLQLRFDNLGQIPQGILPLLVQRRVVQGERVLVAVGELDAANSGWVLQTPVGGAPLLTGGAFAVLVPNQAWNWISGQATVPASVAQPLVQRLGEKARLVSARQIQTQASLKKATQPRATSRVVGSMSQGSGQTPMGSALDDFAVADAMVDAGYLKAVSAGDGSFAVPSFLPSGSTLVTVKGERRDLGVWGSIDASVPSTGQVLRLAQVPFKVLTITPSELTEVGVGTVMEVQLTTAADPSTVSQVRVFQEVVPSPYLVPAPSVALATTSASTKSNALPGSASKSTASKSKAAATVKSPGLKAKKGSLAKAATPTAKAVTPSAKKRNAAKPTSPSEKKALQAVDAPQLVEVSVRRTLSQDGRTLLLTPDAALQPGAVYRVVTTGLASVSNEVAPTYTRRFKTLAQPQFPDVDFSRIRLSYPTDAFDVMVTIPEGSVPPWSIVSVEAPDMGSFGQGVMPPTGDLVFALKANLGERLRVMVQIRDGRSIGGSIGRYVADDGRTTLGVDGGRVEGPGGMSVLLPEGALDQPAEMQVMAVDHEPVVPETALNPGEALLKGIRLRVKGGATLKKQPILEIPTTNLPGLTAPSDSTADETERFGNGALAVFQEQKTTLPDGTEDVFNVLVDTADISSDGKKVVTLGGLRLPDPARGTVVQQLVLPASAKISLARPAAFDMKPGSTASAARPSTQNQLEAAADPTAQGRMGQATAMADLGGAAEMISDWNWSILQSMFYYHSGTVYRNWNGSGLCGGTASAGCYGPLANAEIHRYAGTLGLDAARAGRLARGRLLAVADAQGQYMNVGGPIATIAGARWISLFAVDPRTGETSIDPNSPKPPDLGLPWERRNHSLAITSSGGNPFDPTLTAPRIRAIMVDSNGTTRSVFAAGEQATLRLYLDAQSQPVTYGTLTGSLNQSFGTISSPRANPGNGQTWIPIYTDIPVTLGNEGTWKVSVMGWSPKGTQGGTTLSVMVTSVGKLGPNLPGKPKVISKFPLDGDTDVDPSAIIKIAFSEPILPNFGYLSFSLRVNGQTVGYKVLSQGQEASYLTPAQEVWVVPNQRLSMGAKVEVSVWGLQDLDTPEPNSLDFVSWSFTVHGADQIGELGGVGIFSQMVVHKGKIYTAEDVGTGYYFDGNAFVNDEGMRKQGVRVIDATDPSNPSLGPIFGEYRSWNPPTPEFNNLGLYQGPFAKSSISGMRVATGVSIGGKPRDLLLVATRPWSVQEIVMLGFIAADEYYPTIYHIRHNALWVFDITGDADSMEVSMGSTVPKLLMSTSQGTMSDNWVKGIGSAGGMLGSIRLRGGLSVWDANQWQTSWEQDKGTLSDWTIRYRSAGATGYFPDPSSLVASNGFYNASSASPQSVTSAVISDDGQGRPIGFATMGYAKGLLTYIDGKVGDPMSMATFTAGGPLGMDGRIHDLSAAVNSERATIVEVMKGVWQGANGTEQGTLLLVGTANGTAGKLWVLSATWREYIQGQGYMDVKALATADLGGSILRFTTDSKSMLVGVGTNGGGYIFDLSQLVPTSDGPMKLSPIYNFFSTGPMALVDGLLITADSTGALKKLVIRNLAGTGVLCSDPGWVDGQGNVQSGSGMIVQNLQVELETTGGQTVLPKVPLNQCSWLLVSENGGTPISPISDTFVGRTVQKLNFFLNPGAKPVGSKWILKIWGTDQAGNPFQGISLEQYAAGQGATIPITQQETVP